MSLRAAVDAKWLPTLGDKYVISDKAINEKCKDCCYDRCAPGTWRMQVQNCTISTCSLWPYRPRSKSAALDSSVQKVADLPQERTCA